MTDTQDAIRPTQERFTHDEITIPSQDRDHQHHRPARVETQTQIDRLERRKNITPEQAEAGRRYFQDAYYAGTVPRASVSGSERVDRSVETVSDRYVASTQRRRHAIKALGDLVPVVEWVCVDDLSPYSWALKQGEFPGAGIAVLRIALLTLAKHYGIVRAS
jgi:hypothetical protein